MSQLSSHGVSNIRFLGVPIESRIPVTLVSSSWSFLLTLVADIIKLVFDFVTVKSSLSLLLVAKRKLLKSCLSAPRMHRHSRPLWFRFCVKNDCSCSLRQRAQSQLVIYLLLWFEMTRSSWVILYCILIIVQHFFIIFLISHKFLRSIDFPSNSLSVPSSNLKLSSLDTTLQL